MVLYPAPPAVPSAATGAPVPAWDAISRAQKQAATSWWMVAQPDHAALSGDLAANLMWPGVSELSAEILEAIALHDAGWAPLDAAQTSALCTPSAAPLQFSHTPSARPFSFLEVKPDEFLVAWAGSIGRAEQSSAIGGTLVSHHFSRIARTRLRLAADSADDREKIEHFLEGEGKRRQDLRAEMQQPVEQTERLVEVLQFCDLLSLYLCCGSSEPVEFPQKFDGQMVVIRREQQMYVTTPSIFGTGVSLGVHARLFPSNDSNRAITIPFLLS